MLEVLVVILLCRKNTQNARLRGRKTWWAALYTILLWFIPEVVVMYGYLMMNNLAPTAENLMASSPYAMAGGLAGVLVSYFIAKRGQPVYAPANAPGGMYGMGQAAVPGAGTLLAPCLVTLVHDEDGKGEAGRCSFALNNRPLGNTAAGQRIVVRTAQQYNMLTAVKGNGFSTAKPVAFYAPDGGAIEFHFGDGEFKLGSTVAKQQDGTMVPAQLNPPPPQQAAQQPYAPGGPPPYTPPQQYQPPSPHASPQQYAPPPPPPQEYTPPPAPPQQHDPNQQLPPGMRDAPKHEDE